MNPSRCWTSQLVVQPDTRARVTFSSTEYIRCRYGALSNVALHSLLISTCSAGPAMTKFLRYIPLEEFSIWSCPIACLVWNQRNPSSPEVKSSARYISTTCNVFQGHQQCTAATSQARWGYLAKIIGFDCWAFGLRNAILPTTQNDVLSVNVLMAVSQLPPAWRASAGAHIFGLLVPERGIGGSIPKGSTSFSAAPG